MHVELDCVSQINIVLSQFLIYFLAHLFILTLFALFLVIILALQLPLGKTSVMHLVPRENLPEPNSQGNLQLKEMFE